MKHEKLHIEEIAEGMPVSIYGLECVETTIQKIQKDEHGFYVKCREGKHYIDLDEDTDNEGYFYELFKVADGVDLYEAGSPRPSGAERNRPMDPQKEHLEK